jgi:ribosomal protein S8E
MGYEKKPDLVINAIRNNNREVLSASGKKGAEACRKKRELDADRQEVEHQIAEERRLAEVIEMREATNEHIIPVD